MTVEIIPDVSCDFGESPTWHAASQQLYWSDLQRREVLRLDPESGKHEVVLRGVLASGITIERDGALLLLGTWGAIYRLDPDGLRAVRRVRPAHFGFRFNDCIATASGSVVSGTMGYQTSMRRWPLARGVRGRLQKLGLLASASERPGSLWIISPGGRLQRLAGGLGRPNGMAFSQSLETLYVTDSIQQKIFAFPILLDKGRLGEPTVLVDAGDEDGVPDGLEIDNEGCLWSVQHRGGSVIRYAPNGHKIEHVELPTRRVTSLTFGGRDRSELFITSAASKDPDDRFGGRLFRLSTSSCGGPVFCSQVAA